MTLGVIVITNKPFLPENFLRRLTFADKVLFVFENKKPTLAIPVKNAEYMAATSLDSFAKKRNLGLSKIKTTWAMFVDDDEIVSGELAAEIKQKINQKEYAGFFLTRHDLCFYQELKYGEIKNQKILRLAKVGGGEFLRSVHEVWNINGKIGYLDNVLYHQKDYFISQFINRIRHYGPLDAYSLDHEGKLFTLFNLILFPILKFLNNYFFKLGLMDGFPGLFLAYLMSIQSLSVRIYQWEKITKR